jgi:hypothetical protein
LTVSGVAATRVSPGVDSTGIRSLGKANTTTDPSEVTRSPSRD